MNWTANITPNIKIQYHLFAALKTGFIGSNVLLLSASLLPQIENYFKFERLYAVVHSIVNKYCRTKNVDLEVQLCFFNANGGYHKQITQFM